MARITIHYKTYSYSHPIFTEEEFVRMKAIVEADPYFDPFPIKLFYQYIIELFEEFKYQIAIGLAIGLVLGFLDKRDFFLLLFLPLIAWLLLGGLVTIVNFTSNFNSYNRFHTEMNKQFSTFETYDEYLVFRKYDALKFIS